MVANRNSPEANIALVQAMESALVASQCPLDRFFFDWRGGDLRRENPAYAEADFTVFREAVAAFGPLPNDDHPYWSDAEPCSMLIGDVEEIWAQIAERDDWTGLETKVADIRRMGEAHSLANR